MAPVEIELLPQYKSLPECVEDGDTFEANAILKATQPHTAEAIDMDSYRVEKQKAMAIILPDEDAEIEPIPIRNLLDQLLHPVDGHLPLRVIKNLGREETVTRFVVGWNPSNMTSS